MSTPIQPDSRFQIFIQTFADAFGIVNPGELSTQKREIVPESVEIDTVVTFPDNFDFTTLQDRIFPFFGKENVIEYKGEKDALSLMRLYQYGFTELGILMTHLLSKKRKDRAERQPLSQRAAEAQWMQLVNQGAHHTCTTIILSTTDPTGCREDVGFEPVATYKHLNGALYCWPLAENKFVGSVAAYLVVLNKLPIHPKNAPLLLLSTGKKQTEFFQWLLAEHEEMSIREKERCLFFLVKYNLISNQEVLQEVMQKNKQPEFDNLGYLLDLYAQEPDEKVRAGFFESVLKRFVQTDVPLEVTQKVLQTDSPLEASQKLLQADSPEEAALKLVQSEEQVARLLELIRQRDYQKTETTPSST